MTIKTFGTALIGVAALSSISAYAEAVPGAYVTFRAGYKTMGFSHTADYFTDSYSIPKDKPIAITGRGGTDVSIGWHFDPMFGAEISGFTGLFGAISETQGIDVTKVKVKKTDGTEEDKDGKLNDFSVTQRAVALLGKAVIPVVDDISVMVKGGVAYLISQESAYFTPNVTSGTPTKETLERTAMQTRIAPVISVGLNYALSPEILGIPANLGFSVTGIIPINGTDAPNLKPILFGSAEITTYFS